MLLYNKAFLTSEFNIFSNQMSSKSIPSPIQVIAPSISEYVFAACVKEVQ